MTINVVTLVARQTSVTSAAPSASATPSGSSSGGTTPSLFFIALGVGVVFTNLMLIVGIKYCCRQRRRRFAQDRADIDDTNEELRVLPFYANRSARFRPPPRRRREKKLITLQQLDEQAPIQKYKEWCAHREQNGLPAEGGISSATAQAMSNGETAKIGDQEPNSPTTEFRETIASDSKSTGTVIMTEVEDSTLKSLSKSESESDPVARHEHGNEYEHEHEPNPEREREHQNEYEQEAIEPKPAEPANFDSGDLCAICIDNLELNDNIRALPCHHVFHSDCVTPWLTSRRAICPLCKADFYVSPTEGASESAPEVRTPPLAVAAHGSDHPQLVYPWELFVRPPRSFRGAENRQPHPHLLWPFSRTETQTSQGLSEATSNNTTQPAQRSRVYFWRSRRPNSNEHSPA